MENPAKNGQMDVVLWLEKNCPQALEGHSDAMYYASLGCHLQLCIHLNIGPLKLPFSSKAFTTAAKSSNTTPPVVVQRPVSRYSFVTPPPLSAPLFPPTAGVTTVLPTGLIDILNYSYFLHLLVTDPGRVLPPGKSLLSVMAKPQSTRHEEMELPELKDKIQGVVHKAFWDEVRTGRYRLSVLMLLP